MDLTTAVKIAEENVHKLSADAGTELSLIPAETIERDFGWVFFYESVRAQDSMAGNAPFIVDRHDGSVHPTGTAHPLEAYVESYARIGRTYPFASAEHFVLLDSWKPGFLKISLTKLIREAAGLSLVDAKKCTDDLLEGTLVRLRFENRADAELFCSSADELGVGAKHEVHFR